MFKDPKRDHNFDNHPFGTVVAILGKPMEFSESLEVPTVQHAFGCDSPPNYSQAPLPPGHANCLPTSEPGTLIQADPRSLLIDK